MDTVAGTSLLIVGSSGAGKTVVSALRPEDGLALWTREERGVLDDVVSHAGSVYVATHVEHRDDPTESARILALRAADGSEVWRVDPARLRGPLDSRRLIERTRVTLAQFSLTAGRQTASVVRFAGSHSLATDGGALIASGDALRFAFDTATGALRWMTAPAQGRPVRPFAMRGGRAYVVDALNQIEALDASTGTSLWVAARPRLGGPLQVVAGETALYACGYDLAAHKPVIATLRAEDGALQGTFGVLTGQPDDEAHVLALGEDSVAYALRRRQLCAVRLAAGREMWRAEPFERAHGAGSPDANSLSVVVGKRHVAFSYSQPQGDGYALHVGALDSDSGEPRWRWRSPEFSLPRHGGAPLVVAFENVYLFSSERYYAFHGDDGRLLWSAPAGLGSSLHVAALLGSAPNQ